MTSGDIREGKIVSLRTLAWELAGYADDDIASSGGSGARPPCRVVVGSLILLAFSVFWWTTSDDRSIARPTLSLLLLVVALSVLTSPWWVHRKVGRAVMRFMSYGSDHIANIIAIVVGVAFESFALIQLIAVFVDSDGATNEDTSALTVSAMLAVFFGYLAVSTAPTLLTIVSIAHPLTMIKFSRAVLTVAITIFIFSVGKIVALGSGYALPLGVLITLTIALASSHGSVVWRIAGVASGVDAALIRLGASAQYAVEAGWSAESRRDLRSALEGLRSAWADSPGSRSLSNFGSVMCAPYEYKAVLDWAFFRLFGGEKPKRLDGRHGFEIEHLDGIPDNAIPALLMDFSASILDDLRGQSRRPIRHLFRRPDQVHKMSAI